MKYKQILITLLVIMIGWSYQTLAQSDCGTAIEITGAGTYTALSAPYWYKYTSPRDQSITITSFNTNIDTYLVVVDNCDPSPTYHVDNDDIDGTNALLSSYGTITLIEGQIIYIGWTDDHSIAGFDWQLFTEPEIDFASIDMVPAPGAVDVPIDLTELVLPFMKDIIYKDLTNNVDGTIFLRRSLDSTLIRTYDINELNVAGSNLSFNARVLLDPNTKYFMEVGINDVVDKKAYDFWEASGRILPYPATFLPSEAGFTDPSLWNFTTGDQDVNLPELLSSTPGNGATKVSIVSPISMSFSEPIQLGNPSILTIHKKSNGMLVAEVDLTTNGTLSGDQNTPDVQLEIDITNLLQDQTEYYINIPSGAIADKSGKAFPGITDNTTWSFTTVFPTNQADSLALVALYNATGGKNWDSEWPSGALADQWLVEYVENWYGVAVLNGRVTRLFLPSNNLAGDIPAKISDLGSLIFINLMFNRLRGIAPELAGLPVISTIQLFSNNLEFDDLEVLLSAPAPNSPNITYSGQNNIDPNGEIFVREGEPLNIAYSVGGSNNLYQWLFNGDTIPGETADNLNIPSVTPTEAGTYVLEVTNSVVSNLTISSTGDKVTIIAPNETYFAWMTEGIVAKDKPQGESYGGNWIDFDNDDYLDLYVNNLSSAPSNNFLYKNNTDGTFSKITVGEIVSEEDAGRFGNWADYDNDGDIDLFQPDVGFITDGVSVLYTNNGDGTFIQTSFDLGFGIYGAIWGDINNDGLLDLATISENENVTFLMQNQDHSFTIE